MQFDALGNDTKSPQPGGKGSGNKRDKEKQGDGNVSDENPEGFCCKEAGGACE